VAVATSAGPERDLRCGPVWGPPEAGLAAETDLFELNALGPVGDGNREQASGDGDDAALLEPFRERVGVGQLYWLHDRLTGARARYWRHSPLI
jgi:hypothetical protein